MASIVKGFSVGDTVWVRYPYTATHSAAVSGWVPVSRVVSAIDFIAASYECIVSFTNGNPVQDGAIVRVYLTEALCAAGIITDIISITTACVVLDTTQAVASQTGTATQLNRYKAP